MKKYAVKTDKEAISTLKSWLNVNGAKSDLVTRTECDCDCGRTDAFTATLDDGTYGIIAVCEGCSESDMLMLDVINIK